MFFRRFLLSLCLNFVVGLGVFLPADLKGAAVDLQTQETNQEEKTLVRQAGDRKSLIAQ